MLPTQSDKLARLDGLFAHALTLGDEAEVWFTTLGEADSGFVPTIRSLLEASRESDTAFDTISTTRANFLETLFRRRAEPLAAGTQIGVFMIEALLGRGGFAHVYKARRDNGLFEQTVALKVFDAPVSSESEARRFADECSALARIDHPNMARIIDGGSESDGRAWIAMELVDGLPITQALKAAPEATRLDAICQAASALADAHRQFILHLDIKPANMLLDKDGRIRVLDFGLAQLMEPVRPNTLAAVPAAAMTPAYAAPEQRERLALSVATDVYMLGSVLAELLTGKRPGSEGGVDLNGLPRPLRKIIETCCAVEPGDRYASIDRLISDLERYQQRLPISVSDRPNRDLATSLIMRNPAIALLGFVVALTLAGWAVTSSYLSGLYEEERDRALTQQATAEATTEAFLTVFRRADPLELDTALNPDANAWQYLAAAAEGLRDTLQDEPEALIEVLALAEALHTRAGQFDEAASLRAELVGMTATHYGENSLPAAMAELAAQGPLAAQDGDQGQALLAELEGRLTAYASSDPSQVAYGYLLLAYAWQSVGDPVEAERLASLVLETVPDDQAENLNSRIEALLVLGQIANSAGQSELAAERLRTAVSITETAYGADHARLVGPLSSLSTAYRLLGDYEASIVGQLRSIAIQTRYDGPQSDAVLSLRNNLAITYRAAGQNDLAEAELRELLAIERERSNGVGSELAIRYQNLATALESQGELMDAREAYLAAAELFGDALSDQNVTRWLPYVSLTRVNLKIGDATAAQSAAIAARSGLEPILPEDHFVRDILTCLEGAARMDGPGAFDRDAIEAAANRLQSRAGREEEYNFCLTALGRR